MKFVWRLHKTGSWEWWDCMTNDFDLYSIEAASEFQRLNLRNIGWRTHRTVLRSGAPRGGYLPKDLRGFVSWDCAAIFSLLEEAKKHCEHHYLTLVLQ